MNTSLKVIGLTAMGIEFPESIAFVADSLSLRLLIILI